MEINLELYDPTGVRICTSQVEVPISLYNGEGEPMSQNYYILQIGDKQIKIHKDGSLKIIHNEIQ